MNIRKILATLAALTVGSGVYAADFPPPSVAPEFVAPQGAYDWRGLWVGAHGGYVFGTVTGDTFGAPTSGPSGLDVGLHAFYNFQSGNWVYGPYLALPLVTATGTGGGTNIKLNWAVVGGARLGYALDRWLPYVLAGGVVGGGTTSGGGFDGSNTHLGFTVGAGVDYGYSDRWSIGARYAFVSTDKKSYDGSNPFGWDGHSVVGTLTFRLK